MPAPAADPPSVSLSFANNFWGKEDAGVSPMLERMHSAKVTCDELKSFYTTRAAIEDEYARKMLNLARKPLGSSEAGTLRMSLDVVRGEIEAMGKAHQLIAQQMKSELEEPLAAFAGAMKERRKIVQNGAEKLLKLKTQQTGTVNKTRDKYEQDCLKIKGYLAQGHMVMGQEERKNKAKLEKTQIQLSATSNEYQAAVRVLEETTGRWNRDWKAACDKFQDLEEERIDTLKSNLWNFANIASTVCVSDADSLEKIRLSLEDCEVEKDIVSFIKEVGTGQEIPDAPKYIDFCRGDVDNASEASGEDGSYQVAQFPRSMNPAFRTSSPQPSMLESHHDPNSALAQDMGGPPESQAERQAPQSGKTMQQLHQDQIGGEIPKIPYNENPMDGMTQFCRLDAPSDRSAATSPNRPSSRDSQSDISNPTSMSSVEPSSGMHSPTKQMVPQPPAPQPQAPPQDPKPAQKRKSGFFQGRSPFRRNKPEEDPQRSFAPPQKSSTWAPAAPSVRGGSASPYGSFDGQRPSVSPEPEPADPRASFQLNVGNNVFDVASPDARKHAAVSNPGKEDLDPIVQALAELKGVGKQSSVRQSADRYHGIATPAPSQAGTPTPLAKRQGRGSGQTDPPPQYEQPMSRLGAPQPAFTSRQMQQTTQKYIDQKQNMFNPSAATSSPRSRPGTRAGSGQSQEMVRAASPAPRSASPRPGMPPADQRQRGSYGSAQPGTNPYMAGAGAGRPRAQSSSPMKPNPPGGFGGYAGRGGSPGHAPRAVSPNPHFSRPQQPYAQSRPGSSRGGSADMSVQLAQPPPNDGGGYGGSYRGRPMSYYGAGAPGGYGGGEVSTRVRSKSVADNRQMTKDGRAILHYARALYMYQAAIPEELSFAKGDVLAVLREQDDGWWEAEVMGKRGRPGLVPSNYLERC